MERVGAVQGGQNWPAQRTLDGSGPFRRMGRGEKGGGPANHDVGWGVAEIDCCAHRHHTDLPLSVTGFEAAPVDRAALDFRRRFGCRTSIFVSSNTPSG